MNYKYIYERVGGPLLSWKHGPPRSSYQASTGLGSLGDASLVLPAPGAPEPIQGRGALGGYSRAGMRAGTPRGGLGDCGCSGKKSMGDVNVTCGGGQSSFADFLEFVTSNEFLGGFVVGTLMYSLGKKLL